MMRTPRGRVATGHAYRHFGIKIPQHNLGASESGSSEDMFSSTSPSTSSETTQ